MPKKSVGNFISSQLKNDEYIICRKDGLIVESEHLLLRRAVGTLSSRSIFDFIDSSDAHMLRNFLKKYEDNEKDTYSSLAFDVRSMHGYRYANAEIHSDFGITYMIIRLYRSKQDYLSSDFVKRTRISPMLDSLERSVRCALPKHPAKSNNPLSAKKIHKMLADELSLISMLDSMYAPAYSPVIFDIAEANNKLIKLFGASDIMSLCNFRLSAHAGTEQLKTTHYITDRDIGKYVDMLVTLISVISSFSANAEIELSTDCFDGCARIRISTAIKDSALLTFASSDLGALARFINQSDFKLFKAEYIASCTDTRIYAFGSTVDCSFTFELIITDNGTPPLEFKHKTEACEIDKHFYASVENNFPIN